MRVQLLCSSERNRELEFIAYFLCAESGEGAVASVCMHVQTAAWLPELPRGLANTRPGQLSEANELEANHFGNRHKSWGVRCRVQLLHFSGRSWEVEFSAHSLCTEKEQ